MTLDALLPPEERVGAGGVRVWRVPLGGSALARAMQSGAVPASWVVKAPNSITEWRARVAHIRQSHAAQWLSPLLPAFGPHRDSAAHARLRAAVDSGVVVTTGQQPGLFGGPAYTVTKALTALAFADALQEALEIPVAPVFWAATDDTDFMEAAVTHVIGHHGVHALRLPSAPTSNIAMHDVALGAMEVPWRDLVAACGSASDGQVLDDVRAAYHPQATIGSAYVALLRTWLEPLGVAVLDAANPALRAAADAPVRAALQHAEDVDHALSVRDRALHDAGFLPQVERVDGLSLVFLTEQGARRRIPIRDARASADSAPSGSLGANVLLRPVVERALLPTIAYMAGPGELAYFAQATAVADALHMERPLAVPRCSMEWREPHTDRVLQRLGLQESELLASGHAEHLVARRLVPDDVTDAMERLRVVLESQLAVLRGATDAHDALLHPDVIRGLDRDLSHKLNRVERRLLAAVKRREAEIMRDIAVARAACFPNRSRPERVLSLVPLLARHGIDTLRVLQSVAAEHARELLAGSGPTHARHTADS